MPDSAAKWSSNSAEELEFTRELGRDDVEEKQDEPGNSRLRGKDCLLFE